MLTLAKALCWESIGSSILSKVNLVNIIKIHGKGALRQRQVLNTFYRYLITLKDHSICACLDLMELLLKYGDNFMVVDYYFAYIVIAHQFALNRGQLSEACNIEEVFLHYLEMTKSNAEVALVWLMKIKRQIAQKDYSQAFVNIQSLSKFSSQHDFLHIELEAQILKIQIFIELGDLSQAML